MSGFLESSVPSEPTQGGKLEDKGPCTSSTWEKCPVLTMDGNEAPKSGLTGFDAFTHGDTMTKVYLELLIRKCQFEQINNTYPCIRKARWRRECR